MSAPSKRTQPKQPAKGGGKQSFSRHGQSRGKEVAGPKRRAGARKLPVAESPREIAAITSLPDFSADWRMPAETASTAEIVAHFSYEFARESQTVLALTKRLSHLSGGEIRRGTRLALLKPLNGLQALKAHFPWLAMGRVPDLERMSWQTWQSAKQEPLPPSQEAFRGLDADELWAFQNELVRGHKPSHSENDSKWYRGSWFNCCGVEEAILRIDWKQGPQAVERAMKRWFLKRKGELPELARRGVLPGKPQMAAWYFKTKDEEGAKSPKQKCLVALRGLAAMRLLGRHTLKEAIELTRRETGESLYAGFIDPDTKQPTGRSAWNRGIAKARQVFQELFYSQDEVSLRFRKIEGLPETEEPISYQRYCASEK